jgi:hypothetical protein
MAAVTRSDLECRYSYFLNFVLRSESFDPALPATGHVSLDRVQAYIVRLKTMVSSVTAERSIHKLRRVVQLLAPEQDWEWLKNLEAELYFAAVPRPKFHRIVNPDRVLEAGLTLMREAETIASLSPKKRACRFRNGLMIALLSLIVIRLKNYASLEIGRTLKQVGNQWWVTLPASETSALMSGASAPS